MSQAWHRNGIRPVLRVMARQSVGVVRTLARSENHITHDLDAEIKKSTNVPLTRWQKFRVKGQHVLHGKYVLMLVVALCILDCCLVITELILDIHAVKDALSTYQHSSDNYPGSENSSYPNSSQDGPPTSSVKDRDPDSPHSVHRRAASANGHDIPLTVEIAHACHFASVAILAVLLVYVLLKFLFFGREMFSKKLEMFDAFVVLASFALDLGFLDGLTNGPIEDTAFILSFFVPWRVLRVVNSLVVAILDHEHYKLVVIYKSKKRVERTLDEVREELHEATNRIKKIKELALKSGVEEWKLNLCLVQASKNDGKKGALSSFASFTFGAMTDKNGNKSKSSTAKPAQKPIRVLDLKEVDEKKTTEEKPAEHKRVAHKTNAKSGTAENSGTDYPRSLSGDSALSLSLDAEQPDGTSGPYDSPDGGRSSANHAQSKGASVVNDAPDRTETAGETTSDHTAIQISLPGPEAEEANASEAVGDGGRRQFGCDNSAFVPDDISTKL